MLLLLLLALGTTPESFLPGPLSGPVPPVRAPIPGPSIATMEHHALPAKVSSVVVDALGARVRLVGLTPAQVIALAEKSTLCHRTEQAEGFTVLLCSSRRLHAALDAKGLVLRADAAPPMTTDGSRVPLLHYEPVRFHLGGACPGDTPASRGECAFADGHVDEAAFELRAAFAAGGDRVGHAALRLGDLAWSAGDPEGAANWYDQTGPGSFGRIAATRLCELLSCLDGPSLRLPFDPFDDVGLDADIRAEITLRRARSYAFADRLDDAVHLLLSQKSLAAVCDLQPALCRKIAAVALRDPSTKNPAEALTLALTLPSAFDGEGAMELADAVAEQTRHLGAPIFTANLMAATSSQVPANLLDDWILRCAESYLDAHDTARARAVLLFADSRGFLHGKNASRWRDVGLRLPQDDFITVPSGPPLPTPTPKKKEHP